MKVKGYELMKMIADGKIKDNAIIEVTSYNDKYIFVGGTFWEFDKYYGRTNDELSASVLIANDFEILEDEKEEIKEKYYYSILSEGKFEDNVDEEFRKINTKLNEVIRAINKLNKQDTAKETNCMTD